MECMRPTYENSIHSTRSSTTLSMTKGSNTSIQAKTLGEDILDVVGVNRFEVLVMSTFSDDDDRLTLASFTVLHNAKPIGTQMSRVRGEKLTLLIRLHISSSQESAVGGRSGRRM